MVDSAENSKNVDVFAVCYESVIADNADVVKSHLPWVEKEDALLFLKEAAEHDSVKSFKILASEMNMNFSRISSYFSIAANHDSHKIIQEFEKDIRANQLIYTRVFLDVTRSNAESSFNILFQGAEQHILATALFACLKNCNVKDSCSSRILSALDSDNLSAVLVSFIHETMHYVHDLDEKTITFIDDLMSDLPSSVFDETYPKVHHMAKGERLQKTCARYNRAQFAQAIGQEKAELRAPSSRKM